VNKSISGILDNLTFSISVYDGSSVMLNMATSS